MKSKILLGILGVTLLSTVMTLPVGTVMAANGPQPCDYTSEGDPIYPGFDEFGYNYCANMFLGTYDSADRSFDGTYWGSTGDWVDDHLYMKWSGEFHGHWLANGWLTNQWVSNDGYGAGYTKIVYHPDPCPDGAERIWGSWCIIQDVYQGVAIHATPTGLGYYN